MKPTRHYRHWTAAEDRALRMAWGQSLAVVARELGRTPLTTYWRARKLGLEVGATEGMEYLTAAAKRAGYTIDQLRQILRAAGYRLKRTVSRPGVGGRRRYHMVDPLDVDDAVARWCRQETLQSAAIRVGLSGETLRRLLIAAGHRPPKRRKAHWRVDRPTVDGLVQHYRSRRSLPSVRQHAARIGIDAVTLSKRLRAAGLLGEKRPGNGGLVRLPVDVVDRAIGGRAA